MRISLQDELLCLFDINHFSDNFFKKALVAFLKQNFKSGANQNSKTSFLKFFLSDHALTTGIGVFGKLMCYIASCQAMTKVP